MGTPSKAIYYRLMVDSTRPEAIREIAALYRTHQSLDVVAAALEISTRTLYRWLDQWSELAQAIEGAKQ